MADDQPIDNELRKALIRMSSDIHEIRNLIFAVLLIWAVGIVIAIAAAANG